MGTGRVRGGVRTVLGSLAMAMLLPGAPAGAEEPSLTPPAGPAGLTSPSGVAPAGTSLEQSGPSASQAARDNARPPLPGPGSDGGISGELLAACALAVAGGVAAAASGAHRRRAAL